MIINSVDAQGMSEKGSRTAENQDYFIWDNVMGIYLVADGLGGHPGGEHASKLASEMIHAILREHLISLEPDDSVMRDSIRKAVKSAHDAVMNAQKGVKNVKFMSASVALAVWDKSKHMHVTSVGDCRIYHSKGYDISQVSTDDLDNSSANKLTHALGIRIDDDSRVDKLSVNVNDWFILCSNGISHHISQMQLTDALKNFGKPSRVCKSLLDKASEMNGQDDRTVIAIRIINLSMDQKAINEQKQFIGHLRQFLVKNNQAAFLHIHKKYDQAFKGYISARLKDSQYRSEIEDVLQSSWETILEKLNTYNPDYPFFTFGKIWIDYRINDLFYKKLPKVYAVTVSQDENLYKNKRFYEQELAHDYMVYFKTLMNLNRSPHEILSFSFVKLLGHDVNELIMKYSCSTLYSIADNFLLEYCRVSGIPQETIEGHMVCLRERLNLPVKDLLNNEPREHFMHILSMEAGITTLSNYLAGDKVAQVHRWVSRTKKSLEKLTDIKNG